MMKRPNNLIFILIICLCVSCLSISIGFSAMTTTLSINGNAKFDPVGMINIVSFEQDSNLNSVESTHSHTMDTISVLLDINDPDGYAIYNVKVTNLGETDKELKKIENEIFSNENMEYIIDGLSVGNVVKSKHAVNFKIKFKYKDNVNINETRLNVKLKFKFEDYVKTPIIHSYAYNSEGECVFNGPGNNITGDCAGDTNTDFINTNVAPFSEENYTKNFILKFKIKDVDQSRFSANKRDTIFNMLYEADDKIKGKYPGVLLRIEGNRWQLQGGTGYGNANKVYFSKNDLIGKEIKIIRYNDGNSIKVYYVIGDSEEKLLADLTNLYSTFDTPLTFGANVLIDNVSSDRHAYATLEDMSFAFVDNNLSLDDILGKEKPIIDPIVDPVDAPTVFSQTNACIFNNKTVTGEGCTIYDGYINTNVKLYDSENYQKDFDLEFSISDYIPNNQTDEQVTLMNSFREISGAKGYGVLLRRAKTNLSLIMRNGNGNDKEVTFPASSVSKLRIVRKNGKICYSTNDQNLIYAIDSTNIKAPFNVPVTFGASIDANGNPFRHITGTLSNMSIKLGTLPDTVKCGN